VYPKYNYVLSINDHKTVSVIIPESNLSVITLTRGNTMTFRSLGVQARAAAIKGNYPQIYNSEQ